MTDKEMKGYMAHVIEKLNRIEATVSHNKPVARTSPDPLIAAVDQAAELLESAIGKLELSNPLPAKRAALSFFSERFIRGK